MTDKKAPWDKPPPKHAGATGKLLTPAQLEEARTRAAKAGRRYPNLVDNMAVASGGAGTTAKAPAKKTAAKKTKKKVKALGGRAGARQKTASRRLAKKNKTARRRKK
jgi:hypothetical protein